MSRLIEKILIIFFTTMLCSLSPCLQAQTCVDQIPPTTPSSRFTIHSNGTITDKQTGLIWKRCLEGVSGADCNNGSAVLLNWEQALQRAANTSFAGSSNWRLPNIKELRSIVEQQCFDPAINLTVFPAQAASAVWSSSPNADSVSGAWYVIISNGVTSYTDRGRRGQARQVWLLRGGQ